MKRFRWTFFSVVFSLFVRAAAAFVVSLLNCFGVAWVLFCTVFFHGSHCAMWFTWHGTMRHGARMFVRGDGASIMSTRPCIFFDDMRIDYTWTSLAQLWWRLVMAIGIDGEFSVLVLTNWMATREFSLSIRESSIMTDFRFTRRYARLALLIFEHNFIGKNPINFYRKVPVPSSCGCLIAEKGKYCFQFSIWNRSAELSRWPTNKRTQPS